MVEPKPQEEPQEPIPADQVIREKQDALDTIALERDVELADEVESLQRTAHRQVLKPEDESIGRDLKILSRKIREEQPPVVRNPRNKPPGPNNP